jgi:hypothetical protein
MLEEKTTIDTIEIAEDGTIRLRFGLLVIKDGVVISRKWHRTSCPPGTDIDAQIAVVNADITTRSELMAPPIDTSRLPDLKAIVALIHTPKVIKAHQDKERAEMEALSKRTA